MPRDPYRYFRIEARELLDQLGRHVLDLEKHVDHGDTVSRLLRLAHTLKGAARVVKQLDISDLAHAVEDKLAPYREGSQSVPRSDIDNLLSMLDTMSVKLGEIPDPERSQTVVTRVEGNMPSVAVRADLSEVDVLLEGLSEVHGEIATARRSLKALEQARRSAGWLAEQISIASLSGSDHGAEKISAFSLKLYDALNGCARRMAECVGRADRELSEARELAARLRLVPAHTIFNTLERVARDAAHVSGKCVKFEASGGEVRLDGHVLEAVQAALLQMVRNAVAHGIESSAVRLQAGKPVEGKVSIAVVRRGHRISFCCVDDGAGVDFEAVKRATQNKKILPDDAQSMTPADWLQLLLKGGVTTSGVVTEISGRGIGLDVVREAAERLDGEVSVQSERNVGTTLELQVPVSLASLDALLVQVRDSVAAIPLSAVEGVKRVMADEVSHSAEGDTITVNGRLLPLRWLTPFVAHHSVGSDSTRETAQHRPFSAVIVTDKQRTVAVAVDRLIGTETVVLRPLPTLAPADAIVLGTYLDAEGCPQLVLDPEVLSGPSALREQKEIIAPQPLKPILVVDDSLTTRMLEHSILASAGYVVATATSAEEGLEMARRNRFGLCLVDVEMPGMDGFSFVEHVRADPGLCDVPCILVTSRDAVEDRRRGEAVGACGYIVKSEFDQVDFLRRVAGLVRQ